MRLELRNALWALAGHRRIFDVLREAETLARGLNDRRRLGGSLPTCADHFLRHGQHDRGRRIGSTGPGDRARRSVIFDLQVARPPFWARTPSSGRIPEAIALFKGIVEALDGDRRYERFGSALVAIRSPADAWLAWCHAELGEFSEALAIGDEGRPDRGSRRSPVQRRARPIRPGDTHGCVGETFPRHRRCSSALWRSAEPGSSSPSYLRTPPPSGTRTPLAGRVAEALPLVQGPKVTSRKPRALHVLPRRGTPARRAIGRGAVSRQAGPRPRPRSEGARPRGVGAPAPRRDPRASRSPRGTDRRERTISEALALAEAARHAPARGPLPPRPRDAGRPDGRLPRKRASICPRRRAMYREMGMTFWLEKAEAALERIG